MELITAYPRRKQTTANLSHEPTHIQATPRDQMRLQSALWGWLLLIMAVSASADSKSGEFRSLSLERTACYGDCAVYTVTVASDGTVKFVGIDHVSKQGEQQSQVSPEAVAKLQARLKSIDFFSLRSRKKGRWGCLNYRSDHASIIVRAVTPSDDKTVKLYTGCSETKNSTALIDFARMIDEVAGTSKWIEE